MANIVYNTIVFDTPWDPPFPVYRRMAEQGFCFSFAWTVEPDGGYSGSGHASGGTVESPDCP